MVVFAIIWGVIVLMLIAYDIGHQRGMEQAADRLLESWTESNERGHNNANKNSEQL